MSMNTQTVKQTYVVFVFESMRKDIRKDVLFVVYINISYEPSNQSLGLTEMLGLKREGNVLERVLVKMQVVTLYYNEFS